MATPTIYRWEDRNAEQGAVGTLRGTSTSTVAAMKTYNGPDCSCYTTINVCIGFSSVADKKG